MKEWIQQQRKMLSGGLLALGMIVMLIGGRLPSAFVDLSIFAGQLLVLGGIYLSTWKADSPRVRRNTMILLGILAFLFFAFWLLGLLA